MTLPNALLMEPTDFVAFPVGGQTSFCRQMMSAFGNRLALVGFSTDDTPVGRWQQKTFDGISYQFFSVKRVTPQARKPLVPLRITSYRAFRRYRRQILSLGVRNAFTQAPETLLATYHENWNSYCYASPGIQNALDMSRYPWARLIATTYERRFARALSTVQLILAAADQKEIDGFVERTKNIVPASRISTFPTRVDTDFFHPDASSRVRRQLGIPADIPLIVSCARLSRRKGWDLVLAAFVLFQKTHPTARLVYLGDGEDRLNLTTAIQNAGLQDHVTLAGFQPPSAITQYNAACDVFVNGSYYEGWPVAQLEALACGAALVSTDVSGARDLIRNGANGFLLPDRNPQTMANALADALTLPDRVAVSRSIADRYAVKNLAEELGALWPPLGPPR